MPINSENTEKNEDLKKVSGAIDTPIVADVSEKRSPKSLLDMCIPLIAEDPSLSLMLIQSEEFYAPHITDPLKKITPFIQLLPTELKCELIKFLPVQDWQSLWDVSQEWRQVVLTSAKIFLDQVERDKLPLIQLSLNDFDPILENMQKQVKEYTRGRRYAPNEKRAEQVKEIKKLTLKEHSLTQPLAKFIHCTKKIREIHKAIGSEYSGLQSFFGPRNSQLYSILDSFLRNSQNLIENSPGLKKIKFCASLHLQHAATKRLSETLSEINGQKTRVEEKVKINGDEEKQVVSLSLRG